MPHVLSKQGRLEGMGLAVFLAAAHAANDAMTAMLSVLLPSLQIRFTAGPATLALLVAALWIFSSLAQPLFGSLAERLSLRGVAAIGIGLAATAFGLVGVAPSLGVLFTLVVVGGVGSAALHPAAAAIAAAGRGKRSLAVGLFTAGGMLGFAVAPVLILELVAAQGTGATPWLMLPGLLLALILFFVAPQWEPHARQTGSGALNARLLAGPVGGLVLASALVMFAFLAMTSSLPLWLAAEKGLAADSAVIGWTLAAFALGAAAGSLAGGYLAERLPRAPFAAISLALAAAALTAVTMLAPGSALFYSAAAVAGALLYTTNPLMIVAAQEYAPDSPAAAAGMVLGVGSALAGVLYVALGVLQEAYGLAPGLKVAFFLVLPAAALAALVLARPLPAGLPTRSAGAA
jgi:FSR family fosmidomycin resistance protein-like MFS transporter